MKGRVRSERVDESQVAGAKLIAWQDLYVLAVVGLIVILRSVGLRQLNETAARGAAFVAYHLSIAKRRRADENLSQRLGGRHSVAERQRIVRRMFYETWRELLSWADADVVDETEAAVDVEGLEHLHSALHAGSGAVLWESNGFGQRKLMKRILRARGIELHQVHGPNDTGGFLLNDPPSLIVGRMLRNYFDRCEKCFVVDTVYIPDSNSLVFARTLISRLRGTTVLCVPGDGEFGRHRVSCEFLSAPFSFATGAVSLARLSNAALLPVFCVKTDQGRTRVIIEPSLRAPRGVTRDSGFESSLSRYASLLDDYVRRYPEQYRNWHLLNQADETP
jgi:lauroyl/myristoyl acyltransferase